MELDARKLRILQAIVDDYILTAAPVGSRTIARKTDLGLSSATIRNEMSDLEEMGYLEQPHTSAGRIPSDKAYRLYVNTIMHRARLTDDERELVRSYYSKRINEVDDIVRQTAYALSSVTQYTSMVLSPRLHAARLKYIHFVPLTDEKAIVILVTDAGLAKDYPIKLPNDMNIERLDRLSQMLNKRLSGLRLDEINTVALDEVAGELTAQKDFLDAVMESLKMSMDESTRRVELAGATNILNYPEYSDVERARTLMNTMERRDLLYGMLSGTGDVEFTITIGGENRDENLRDCSIVTAKYRVGKEPLGSFGVIGPTRMNYSRVLAVMSLIGRDLSEVLTNMFEEEHK